MATAEERAALAADTDFLRQQAAIKRALEQFGAGQVATAGARKLDLSNAYNSLGYNPDQNSFDVFDKQRGYAQATNAARQNFAGRGMLRSSGALAARAGIGTKFEQQATNLKQGQSQFESGQTLDKQAFESEQADALDSARLSALRRYQDARRAGLF
jgi:hypothetical protein